MRTLMVVQISGGTVAAVDFENGLVGMVVASSGETAEAFGGRIRGSEALEFVDRLGQMPGVIRAVMPPAAFLAQSREELEALLAPAATFAAMLFPRR